VAKKGVKKVAWATRGVACKPRYELPEGHTLFTSEAVTVGHPDKICDQVSDAVLDAMIAQDRYSRVACETLVTTGLCLVAGEVTTKAQVNIQDVVRQTIREIGYTDASMGFAWDHCSVLVALHGQSPDIARGVDAGENKEQGAGDQGLPRDPPTHAHAYPDGPRVVHPPEGRARAGGPPMAPARRQEPGDHSVR
jgi:hypothetical protein